MEIKVNADGEVILNVDNGEIDKAMEMVHALQRDARKKHEQSHRSELGRQSQRKVNDTELNSIQYNTWSYLVDNDCVEGIHVSQVAKAFGLSKPSANTRLVVLTNMGYAKRVHRGYYRAVTGDTSSQIAED